MSGRSWRFPITTWWFPKRTTSQGVNALIANLARKSKGTRRNKLFSWSYASLVVFISRVFFGASRETSDNEKFVCQQARESVCTQHSKKSWLTRVALPRREAHCKPPMSPSVRCPMLNHTKKKCLFLTRSSLLPSFQACEHFQGSGYTERTAITEIKTAYKNFRPFWKNTYTLRQHRSCETFAKWRESLSSASCQDRALIVLKTNHVVIITRKLNL